MCLSVVPVRSDLASVGGKIVIKHWKIVYSQTMMHDILFLRSPHDPQKGRSIMQILQLDIQGVPQAWLTPNEAATQYATDSVVWTVGDVCSTLRGGTNAYTGLLSTIDLHPIIALRGACKRSLFDVTPTLINSKLFRRDRWTCAYCGDRFDDRSLTRDHILFDPANFAFVHAGNSRFARAHALGKFGPSSVEQKMRWLHGTLSEKDRRRYAGIEADKLGHGGIEYISGLFGIDPKTVRKGLTELELGEDTAGERVRKKGADAIS